MQATNKQSKFNIPGGGWITIEQAGDKLITQAEGNAAGLLASQVAQKEMTYAQAVAHCKMCLKPAKGILQEAIEQQLDFVDWCQGQIIIVGNKNLDARNEYEALINNANFGIRLLHRRLNRIK